MLIIKNLYMLELGWKSIDWFYLIHNKTIQIVDLCYCFFSRKFSLFNSNGYWFFFFELLELLNWIAGFVSHTYQLLSHILISISSFTLWNSFSDLSFTMLSWSKRWILFFTASIGSLYYWFMFLDSFQCNSQWTHIQYQSFTFW